MPPGPDTAPSAPPGAAASGAFATRPAAVPATGDSDGPGLGGLREEMLSELERLKKIMRGG
jgi:hypothetical protein